MTDKDRMCIHCMEHSGLEECIIQQKAKLTEVNDSNTHAHRRIDYCVKNSTFQWIVGMLIGVVIMAAGSNLGVLLTMSKNIAVLTSKVAQIEKQIDNQICKGERNGG